MRRIGEYHRRPRRLRRQLGTNRFDFCTVSGAPSGNTCHVARETAVERWTVAELQAAVGGGRFWQEAPELLERTATGVASALGATAAVNYKRLTGPLVNDPAMTALMACPRTGPGRA